MKLVPANDGIPALLGLNNERDDYILVYHVLDGGNVSLVISIFNTRDETVITKDMVNDDSFVEQVYSAVMDDGVIKPEVGTPINIAVLSPKSWIRI